MDELRACPFCGAEARFYLTEPMQIMCKNGHVFSGQFGYIGSREHLVSAWNTRPNEQDIEALANAIEPFAKLCVQINDDEDDEEWAKFRLLIKDYRRAHSALAPFRRNG